MSLRHPSEVHYISQKEETLKIRPKNIRDISEFCRYPKDVNRTINYFWFFIFSGTSAGRPSDVRCMQQTSKISDGRPEDIAPIPRSTQIYTVRLEGV